MFTLQLVEWGKTNRTNLRRGVDEASWMSGPRVRCHLDYRLDGGQREGPELDGSTTARRRIRLLQKDIQSGLKSCTRPAENMDKRWLLLRSRYSYKDFYDCMKTGDG